MRFYKEYKQLDFSIWLIITNWVISEHFGKRPPDCKLSLCSILPIRCWFDATLEPRPLLLRMEQRALFLFSEKFQFETLRQGPKIKVIDENAQNFRNWSVIVKKCQWNIPFLITGIPGIPVLVYQYTILDAGFKLKLCHIETLHQGLQIKDSNFDINKIFHSLHQNTICNRDPKLTLYLFMV